MSTTGYGLEEQINDLNAELRDTRATLRQSLQHRDTMRAELAEARAQIAAKDAEIARLQQALLTCAAIPHMGQYTGSQVKAAIEASRPWSKQPDKRSTP
jgi:septal ring factor EnvC (AmiA/AmiB activator)